MRMRTCLTVVLAVALVVGAMVPCAGAACTVQGIAVGLSNYYNTTTWDLWTIIYVKPDINSTNPMAPLTYFTTKEPGLINLANMAVMTGHPVQIQGNVTSCPGSGDIRFGGEVEVMKSW